MRGSAAALALLLAACGARPLPPPAAPPPAAADDARALPPPGEFYTPGLPTYGHAKGLETTATERRLRTVLGRALIPPPALDCVAREYAARFAADVRDPDPGTLQALARHCGYWAQPAKAFSITADNAAKLEAALRRLPLQDLTGAIALGAVVHPDGKVTASLLASPEQIRIDALSRTAPAFLTGRAFTGGGCLELWVDDGRKLDLKVAPNGAFEANVPKGTHTLELARSNGRFRRTLAVAALGIAPTRYAPSAAPKQDADVRVALANSVNARRTTKLVSVPRLGALLDDWMGRIARAGAGDAPEGLLDDRGWPYADLHFGISNGHDAAQVIALLAATPTGRALVAAPEATQFAFGVRPYKDGIDVVVVTLRPFEQKPAEEARASLLKGLNDARAAKGLSPLALARPLTGEAQAVAASVLAGETKWRDSVQAAMGRIREKRMARGGFGAGAYTAVVPDGADFAKQPQAMAPKMRHVGIGFAAGPLPGGGAPRYVVVFVVAERLPHEKKTAAKPAG